MRLFAKAEDLRQTEAAAFSLPARAHYEGAQARAEVALGAAAPVVATAGQALTLEQALAEAEVVLGWDSVEGADVASVNVSMRETRPAAGEHFGSRPAHPLR